MNCKCIVCGIIFINKEGLPHLKHSHGPQCMHTKCYLDTLPEELKPK